MRFCKRTHADDLRRDGQSKDQNDGTDVPLRRRANAEHCSVQSGAAYDAGAALPRIHRPRRNGQVAAAERLHCQGAPHGCTSGGHLQVSFTNFTSGKSHSFGGEYLELTKNERVRWTDRFDDPNLPGEMRVTVSLKKVSVGTEVNIVQEGIPDVIPPDACTLGWQESLALLAKLVEVEIPD